MAGILDTILGGLTKQYDIAMPAVNFVRGLALGPKEALMTPSMQLDLARRAENKGGDKGALGYEDFGLDVRQQMDRFTGGLFSLDPTAFANVGSVGRVTYEKDPSQIGGYKYGSTMFDFTPDKDTGSTGNKILDFINEGGLAQKLANLNLSNTLSNLAFTPAYGDIPTKEERQGIESFDNLVSETVMAEPQKGFEDYPGVENLGGVQNFDLEGVRDIISQMEEEKGNYIERPEDGFNMDGILQNLKDYLPFIGDKSITGMLTRGIGQFFNNIGDRIPSTPQYQRYTPGYNYGNLNPNLIDDFYDPATGLNRFDRAKTLFGQSRTLSEFLSKRRERAAAEADLVQRREIERKLEREKALARNTSSNIDYGGFVSGGGTHSSDSSFTGHSSATGGGMGQSGWGGPRADGGFIGQYSNGGLATMFRRKQ